jgi:cytochrome c oxidase cbb3-type subunit I
MDFTIAFFIALCFVLSMTALFAFIWSLGHEGKSLLNGDGNIIFDEQELGKSEEPAIDGPLPLERGKAVNVETINYRSGTEQEINTRISIDTSSKLPVLMFLTSALFWLILGSLAGVLVSLKFHFPDFLVNNIELTFGRIRPVHLNAVVYGWASMAGVGVVLWLLPRLLKTELVGGRYAASSCILWNIALLIGAYQILTGHTQGMEFLEVPWHTDILIIFAGAIVAIPLFLTLAHRKAEHLYVSGWYFSAALIWFPVIFFIGNVPGIFTGAEQAIVNWWFGHNILGLWVTPIAVGCAYYFIPKVLGVSVYSYRLSLIGFWALALFYSQVGVHHLLGGPVPIWLQTLSIVQSVMMLIPITAFIINMYSILKGRWSVVKYSPTLRFMLIGASMYAGASVQGTLEAIRSVNYLVHFTHYTVAHAHLGLYAFFTMIMFGAMYFVLPRVTQSEWPYPKLISWHFWLSLLGIILYFVALTIAGIKQGFALADPSIPFIESMKVTIPYLELRSVAGIMMTISHVIFAWHFLAIILKKRITANKQSTTLTPTEA